MKRSEINAIIRNAVEFFKQKKFVLPVWGYWKLEEWYKQDMRLAKEIVENGLGWDITDYGGGDFYKKGLVLFTVRNGNIKRDKKSYAEKIMISERKQECPMHFHWSKMEDIINRGGDNLVIELYGSDINGNFTDEQVMVSIDGIVRNVKSGGKVVLKPGESICLTQGMYHKFYGENGRVLIGEVSTVNDDFNDNRFYEEQGRFPEIEEDEEPEYLLCNDYKKYLKI